MKKLLLLLILSITAIISQAQNVNGDNLRIYKDAIIGEDGSATINMNSNRVQGVADPADSLDALNLQYFNTNALRIIGDSTQFIKGDGSLDYVLYEPILPDTPTSPDSKFLNGNRLWTEIALGSGGYAANLYLSAIASDVVGYKSLSYTNDLLETECTSSVSLGDGEVVCDVFLFEDELGVEILPAGKWSLSFYAKVSSTAGTTTIRPELFIRHTDDSETILDTSISEEINNTDYPTVPHEIEKSLAQFTTLTTDRLGVRFYASTTSNVSRTITLIVGDGRGAYMTTPLELRHNQLRDLNGDPEVQHMTSAEKIVLDNTSGVNTGDQDLSGYLSSMPTLQEVTTTSLEYSKTTNKVEFSNWVNFDERIFVSGDVIVGEGQVYRYVASNLSKVLIKADVNDEVTIGNGDVTNNYFYGNINATGELSASNLSGTNTGDQDLTNVAYTDVNNNFVGQDITGDLDVSDYLKTKGVRISPTATTGSSAKALSFRNYANTETLGGFGALYLDDEISYLYAGKAWNDTGIKVYLDANVDLFYNNARKLATTLTGVDVTGNIVASGSVTATTDMNCVDLNYTGTLNPISDKRMKDSIQSLQFDKEKYLLLNPISSYYNYDPTKTIHGSFLAQELDVLYPNLVKHSDTRIVVDRQIVDISSLDSIAQSNIKDEDKLLTIRPMSIIPLNTLATQKALIKCDSLQLIVDDNKLQIETLKSLYKNLDDRLEVLEN